MSLTHLVDRYSAIMNTSLKELLNIWRPDIPDSIDGKPLATELHHAFKEFPYERLPLNPWVSVFLQPEVLAALLLFYLVSKPLLKQVRDIIAFNPKDESFRNFVAVHNLALAVFSGVCAWNSWMITLPFFWKRGLFDTYCDRDGQVWHAGIGAWAIVFYISKFYEFGDTWILVLKGKQPSFLQVFHHTGVAFTMWGGVITQSSWLLIVVLLNSVIHTLMYSYFFIKTIYPKIEIKAARYLTMAQITQFMMGNLSSIGVFFRADGCSTRASMFFAALFQLYGYALIALFVAFARRKYKVE